MMKRVSLLMLSLGVALGVSAQAADPAQSRDPSQATRQAQTQGSERVYGYDLMTEKERTEYQDRMRAAKTDQEREALRAEHHKQMQVRAKAQGKTLPDVPPAGRGQGPGPGPFQGTGGGQGKGPSEQAGTAQQAQTQGSERVYGYDLMTQQERTEYQDRMRAAKTNQERETLRLEHHKQMEARAKAQGKALHEVPPAGRGQGPSPSPSPSPSGGGGY
jgi:opacity protein-like surface antigen